MLALSDAVNDGRIPNAAIAIVVSDKANARGLELAKERRIETRAIERRGRTREEHEREIIHVLRKYQVDLICLAGFMRVLSPCFIEAFRGKILNIHPSLLPAFPGLDAQYQALAHGVKITGCTVHFVNEDLDSGPILIQSAVPVVDDDTLEALSARILVEEHRIYSEAIAWMLKGNYRIEGRRVIV